MYYFRLNFSAVLGGETALFVLKNGRQWILYCGTVGRHANHGSIICYFLPTAIWKFLQSDIRYIRYAYMHFKNSLLYLSKLELLMMRNTRLWIHRILESRLVGGREQMIPQAIYGSQAGRSLPLVYGVRLHH